VLAVVLLCSSLAACRPPLCPSYMTEEEVKELKPVKTKKDRNGRIKKKGMR
jgi:hypothetical protein